MNRLSTASIIALVATIFLGLSFLIMPFLNAPIIADDAFVLTEDGEMTYESITALALVFDNAPEMAYSLPQINLLTVATVLAVIAMAASFVPAITRTSRYVLMLAGILAIPGFFFVPFQFLPETDITNYALMLGYGFWVGVLAALVLVLQALMGNESDAITDSVSNFAKNVHITRQQILSAILLLIGLASVYLGLTGFQRELITLTDRSQYPINLLEGDTIAVELLTEIDLPLVQVVRETRADEEADIVEFNTSSFEFEAAETDSYLIIVPDAESIEWTILPPVVKTQLGFTSHSFLPGDVNHEGTATEEAIEYTIDLKETDRISISLESANTGLLISVLNADGEELASNGAGSTSLAFTPQVEGTYTITVLREGETTADDSFNLRIEYLPAPPMILVVPTGAFIMLSGVYFLIVGALGIANLEALNRAMPVLFILAAVVIFLALLVGAAAGGSTNVTTMIVESLRTATPIAIGAMAGIWCERSGVINIAIEGMMLFGAAIGFTTLFLLQAWYPDPNLLYLHMFLGVIFAVLAGGLASLLHAWLSITFATDQIVSGTVINILAVGATSYIRSEVLLSSEAGLRKLPVIEIPILSQLPIIGPIFASQPIFYLMFVVIILTHVMLYQTRWGLRTIAVGENPHAADTLGIKVNRVRWINVFIGGMIAGLAGAWFSLEATGRFTDEMTSGKGFISLAAMIFGKWTPAGSFGGSMLFGFSEALGLRFQILSVALPPQFLQMVPYVVTLIVLAGLVGRAIPPRAVGQPYKTEGSR